MLHVINSLSDPLCLLVRDDPVRPEIPIEQRVSEGAEIFVLLDSYGKPEAVVCVRYRDTVPRSVIELDHPNMLDPHVAVFYTIWSYRSGAGRTLIQGAVSWLQSQRKNIQKFVTLSPPTEMARTFHLRNGAGVLSVNADTVNYEYNL